MKILFDQGTPVPLREHMPEHNIDTAFELGWSQLQNGELLNEAEKSGYEVMITTDRNLKYQQNLSRRRLAILVLLTTSWPLIQQRVEDIRAKLASLSSGDYAEIAF
jgi:hypothetical protein